MSQLPDHLCKPRLRRWEASEYLKLKFGMTVAAATLAKWASVGGGPPFNRFNRKPLYPIELLDEWAEAKLGPVFKNTSQADDGT